VPIPKKSGGVRILGIPTVADRVAQTAVKKWLEPRLDPLFCTDSYGYRPGKSAHDALAATRRRCWDHDWVVEFDIKGLLDVVSYVTDASATPSQLGHDLTKLREHWAARVSQWKMPTLMPCINTGTKAINIAG
jgi:hypothetical protein